MNKIKKYIIGFFTMLSGILFAFLSGKSAGKKLQKIKEVRDKIKEVDADIKKTKKNQKALKKSLESKKEALEEIKKQREQFGVRDRNTSTKDAVDFLKKYSKGKK